MEDTLNVRSGHDLYKALPEQTRETIDRAFVMVADVFRADGFAATNGDEAEELIAAMTIYLRKSNGRLALA